MTFNEFTFAPKACRAGRIKLHKRSCGHLNHLESDEMGMVIIPSEDVDSENEFHYCPDCTDLKSSEIEYQGY